MKNGNSLFWFVKMRNPGRTEAKTSTGSRFLQGEINTAFPGGMRMSQ